MSRAVVAHKAQRPEDVLQLVAQRPQRLVAVVAAHPREVDLNVDDGELAVQTNGAVAIHHGVAPLAVGQAALFVHIEIVVHKIAQTSEEDGAEAAQKEEQYHRQGRIELQVELRVDHDAVLHLDVVRTVDLIELFNGLDGKLIQAGEFLYQLVDAVAGPLGLGAGGVGVPGHIGVGVQDLLCLSLRDGGVDALSVEVGVMLDELIVGGGDIAGGLGGVVPHHIGDDLGLAAVGVPVGRIDRCAVQRLVAELVDDVLGLRDVVVQAVDLKLVAQDGVLLGVDQKVVVPHQLIVDNVGVKVVQGVLGQIFILRYEVREGIARFHAVKAVFLFCLFSQKSRTLVGVVAQDLHAINILVVRHRDVAGIVRENIRVHMGLAVVLKVVRQHRVQHIAGVVGGVLAVHREGDRVGRGIILVFVTVGKSRLLFGLFVLRDDLLHRDPGADGLGAGRQAQILNGLVDD